MATLLRAACVSNETFSRWRPGEVSLYGPITASDGYPWHPGMRLESLT